MQRSAAATGSNQNAGIVFLTNIWGNATSSSNHSNLNSNSNSSNSNSKSNSNNHSDPNSQSQSHSNGTRSRPGTSSGDQNQNPNQNQQSSTTSSNNINFGSSIFTSSKDKDHHTRRPSFGRKASFSSPSKGKRRQSSSASNGHSAQGVVTDASTPPALPDLAKYLSREHYHNHHHNHHHKDAEVAPSPASGDSFSKMIGRSAPTPTNGFYSSSAVSPPIVASGLLQPEAPSLHQHIQDIANKRISTLDYLRKAHEGRVYWFNTLLFDKPDLQRMPYFDGRKIARRATNYLLLGLSLPAVIDLNSSTPLEFLRSLNTLLAEFESYQQIHTETGVSTSSLSRARFPQMFRRGAGGKGRRQSGAAGAGMDYFDGGGPVGNGANGGGELAADGSAVNSAPAGVISFGLGGEGNDLLPGEEYTHLLTPNLPFDPDFFETFATLCDVLIDCYTRLMSLLPTPRDCSPIVAELFHKADSRVRKIIVQGVVKEFEDSSRAGLKQEVASVGKVVLGGLI
ncbi:hypothetical protein F4810DRAFT_88623 [Camillea tinctor]|nr:hypothetical protein F4810DRAFT_88623 [Camillea tinctor]